MLLYERDGGEAVARRANQSEQRGAERVRQMRGLILLALAALLFAVLRAGVGRVFTPGWWRLW
ncbi:MAG TPA: hypothetical protein VH250_02765 [Granulicella sp.]|jgi:hypothetical protein|nr:hypothetical protein [Granulicella sp.]